MNLLKLPLSFLLIIAVVAVPVAGQQKRRAPEKTPAKAPAAPAPAPTPTPTPAEPVTFETLLAADVYKIYGEARGVGQLVRSNAANDVLEPLFKLSNPPAEFTDVVNFLRTHSDELMTSRMMVGAWPNMPEVPDVMVAIEFSSVEEATKFESKLNKMLAKILPPVTPPSEPESENKPKQDKPQANEKPKEPPAPVPSYYLQRTDSLVLISHKPLQLKKLRPKGSKLLAEDANFRTAYNRFSSEPIFVFVDIKAMQRENEERRKKAEEEWKKQREAQEAAEAKQKAEGEEKGEAEDNFTLTEEVVGVPTLSATAQPSPETPAETPKEPTDAEVLGHAFSGLRNLIFGVQPVTPTALGIGFTPDNESFDVRALMIDPAGELSDPIPIFSGLKVGDPVTPESPGILPADSELVVMLSLDFPLIQEIAAAFETPDHILVDASVAEDTARPVMRQPVELAAPLKTIERVLKINVKDELLPLLGSEVAVSMPVSEFGLFGIGLAGPRPMQPKNDSKPRSPFVVISLRDREGMRRMMPRILEGFAGKAAAALAQSEKREDTELVSIANMFAYAFVGNFLVIGIDAGTTRYVVDNYLKGETLGATAHFKNYTRWQPRQLQAHLYVSPAFAESFKTWANSPSAPISDEARAFMTRVATNPQPITYALSNDGLGWLHEAHFPKSLIVTAIASGASSSNPPQTVKNERMAMSVLWSIYSAQYRYKEEKKGGYASLEDLISADMVSKEMMEGSGYKFELRLVPEGFEVSAVPVEYGKTGRLSFFMDHQAASIKGGDHGGGPASASDLPIGY